VCKDLKALGLLLVVGSPSLLKISLSLYQGFLTGKRCFALSRKFLIAENLIHLIGVGTVAVITRDVVYVLLGSVMIRLGVSLWGHFVSKRLIVKCNQDKAMEKQLMGLGWRMTFLGCFGSVSTHLERIILGIMEPASLALYHIGAIFPRTIKENVKNLLAVPYTHWMKHDRLENMSKLNKYWWLFVGIGILFFGFILLTADFIIPLLYSSTYKQSAMIAKWLSLSLIFIFLQTMISRFGLYQGSEKVVQYMTIGGSVLRIFLFVVLIPRFVIMGVIYSILLSEFVVFVGYLIWYGVEARKIKGVYRMQDHIVEKSLNT
jgi:O-antigen/teichoic acid export membrane protein